MSKYKCFRCRDRGMLENTSERVKCGEDVYIRCPDCNPYKEGDERLSEEDEKMLKEMGRLLSLSPIEKCKRIQQLERELAQVTKERDDLLKQLEAQRIKCETFHKPNEKGASDE